MIVIVCINCIGVLAYARVESGLGLMKILLVVGAFFTMLGINQKGKSTHRTLKTLLTEKILEQIRWMGA